MRRLDEGPLNGDIACAERSNGSESGFREIDRVHAIACGAGICDGDVDGLAIVCVGDMDLSSAERRFDVKSAIPSVVHGGNQVLVTMNCSTGTSYIVLIKEGGVSTRLNGTGARGGGRGGGRRRRRSRGRGRLGGMSGRGGRGRERFGIELGGRRGRRLGRSGRRRRFGRG
jgi:hypothetical protein